MKRITCIIIILAIGCVSIAMTVFQIKSKKIYEEQMASESTLEEFSLKMASEEDLYKINEITKEWDLLHEDTTTINTALELTAYPRDIDGLVDFWGHTPLPYSFINHARNKREILINQTQDLCFEHGRFNKSEGILFRFNDKMAIIYKERKNGVTSYTYANR